MFSTKPLILSLKAKALSKNPLQHFLSQFLLTIFHPITRQLIFLFLKFLQVFACLIFFLHLIPRTLYFSSLFVNQFLQFFFQTIALKFLKYELALSLVFLPLFLLPRFFRFRTTRKSIFPLLFHEKI